MHVRIVRHAPLGFLATLGALGVDANARAEVAFPFSVVTLPSTAGSFGLYIGNTDADECRSLVGQLGLESGQPLRIRELSSCEFAVTPLTPLVAGTHCLRPLLPDEPAQCIDVTARIADPRQGTVEFTLRYEGGGRALSCYACGSSDGEACTRGERYLVLHIGLTGAHEEVAAGYAFAVQISSHVPAADETPPEATEFRLLGRIEDAFYPARPPFDGEELCATLYAQPFEPGETVRLGSACLGPQGPREGPIRYDVQPPCLLAHWQHWCDDNRADCQGDYGTQLWHCRDYDAVCAKEPDPDLINTPDPLFPTRSPDVDAGYADADADAGAPEPPDAAESARRPATSDRAVGCSLGSTRSDAAFALLLGLSSLWWVRRRGRPRG